MSTFDAFHSNAWSDHFKQTAKVAASFPEGLALVEKPEQLAMLAKLIAHVEGEHLGEWERGRQGLAKIRAHKLFGKGVEADVDRFDRVLRFCGGEPAAVEGLLPSDLARVLALASAGPSGRNHDERADAAFSAAMEQAERLDKADPAMRELAATCNNLALALEFSEKRSERGTALMVRAAQAGRRFWERAGTWLHVERAEYRLAMSYLQAKKPIEAMLHAEKCLEICAANAAEPMEAFFGLEALALAQHAAGKKQEFLDSREKARALFASIPEGTRSWCQEALDGLAKLS